MTIEENKCVTAGCTTFPCCYNVYMFESPERARALIRILPKGTRVYTHLAIADLYDMKNGITNPPRGIHVCNMLTDPIGVICMDDKTTAIFIAGACPLLIKLGCSIYSDKIHRPKSCFDCEKDGVFCLARKKCESR